MAPPVLIIGTAFDGPGDSVVQPSSILDAFEMFGGYVYENHSVGATDTEITLTNADPVGLQFMVWSDYELEDTEVHVVGVTGTTLEIERLGEARDIVIKYPRPLVTVGNTVYKAFAEAMSGANGNVGVMRLGGAQASVRLGTSSGVDVYADYAGSIYNSAYIAVTGSTMTVHYPAGKFPDRDYDISGMTSEELAWAINLDYDKGYGCLTAEFFGVGTHDVVDGNYNLIGGADGEYSDDALTALLEGTSLSGVAVVHVAGVPVEISTIPGVQNISNVITDDFLNDLDHPAMLVAQILCSDDIAQAAKVAKYVSSKPIAHALASLVVGETVYNYGIYPAYSASVAPVYAALLGSNPLGCLFVDTKLTTISPIYPPASLVSLRDAGYVVFTDTQSRGVTVFSDLASSPDWDTVSFIAYTTTYNICMSYLRELLGQTHVTAQDVQSDLEAIIAGMPAVQAYSVDVAIRGSVIYAAIVIRPLGKVTVINFEISVVL